MTTFNLVPSVPWGERTSLLSKQMRYALSLEFTASASSFYLDVAATRATKDGAPDPAQSALWHLFDESVITMPEGVRCNVPVFRIRNGVGQIGTASSPASTNLSVNINGDLDDGAPLNLSCLGVVSFRGGSNTLSTPASKSLTGSCFIATSCETVSATSRWLTRRQLFGVGNVRGQRHLTAAESREMLDGAVDAEKLLSTKPWELVFSFDLYAAF